jgi:hypothetical protein
MFRPVKSSAKSQYLIQANTKDLTEQKLLAAAAKLLENEEKLSVSGQKETQTMSLKEIFSKALEKSETVSLSPTPGLFLNLDTELAKKEEDAKSNNVVKVKVDNEKKSEDAGKSLANQWRDCDDACGCTKQMEKLNEARCLGQVYMLNTRNSEYQMKVLNEKKWEHLQMVAVTEKLLEVLPTIFVGGLNEERPRRFLAVYQPEDNKMVPYVFNVPNKMTVESAKTFMQDVQQALLPKRSLSPVLE